MYIGKCNHSMFATNFTCVMSCNHEEDQSLTRSLILFYFILFTSVHFYPKRDEYPGHFIDYQDQDWILTIIASGDCL